MANTDSPFGLRLVRHRNGAGFNAAVNPYYIPSSYATALFIGDPVIKTGTSNTSGVEGTGGSMFAAGTLPEINKATAGDGNAITGVIVGFEPTKTNLENKHSAASTEGVAYVCDDPDALFEIQDDSAGGTALAATSVGLNAVVIYTHAGSTITGLSGVELDTSSDAPAADASNQLTIQSLVNRVDNEIGTSAKWLVKINNHTEAHGALGI